MSPAERRRNSLVLLLVTLLCLFETTAAVSAVLGVDLGTSYLKAVLVKPGIPFEIVLSKDSKRKESAAVAFKSSTNGLGSASEVDRQWPERLYGGNALALTARFPGDVYTNLKPLLGTSVGDDVVSEFLGRYPGVEIVNVNGTVGFRSKSAGDETFRVEELLAMQLKNVKENAETMAGKGSQINNAVITVPSFFTADERRAVMTAGELAGLNVLALVSDGLAVGLNYATARTFEAGKPEFHLVLDMGAGSTTASVLRFQGRTVKDVGRYNKTVQEVAALGSGWDRVLGGDTLNMLIVEDMINRFVNSPKAIEAGIEAGAVRSHGRTKAKLWRDAEKVRQVLSANTEAGTSFEGLYDDIDFRYKLSRTDFENLASPYVDRVDEVFRQALEAANMKMEDLDSVILHGGVVRTPFVQKRLEALVIDSAKLRSNVNADEAAAFGAAFKGAGLSPSFRVKEIYDSDVAGYAAGVKWTSEGKDRQQKLFTPTSQVGPSKHEPIKQMSFKNLEDFAFTFYQQIDGNDRPITEVQTRNLTASVKELVDKNGCARSGLAPTFNIKMDALIGLPEVAEGSVSCEVEKGSVVNNVKDFFGLGGKKEQEPLKAESSAAESDSSSSPPASEETPLVDTDVKKDGKPTKRTVLLKIDLDSVPKGNVIMTSSELVAVRARLSSFDKSDQTRRTRDEVFNQLEGFTYRVRDFLEDESFVAAAAKDVIAKVQEQLKTTNEWLYGEGSEAPLTVLRPKLADLKALVDPIMKRKTEAAQRPEKVRLLKEALGATESLVRMVKDQTEQASSASASAASASSASAASDSAAISPSASPSVGSLTELEEESSKSSTTATAAPEMSYSPYTEQDLAEVSTLYQSIERWLKDKLAEQEKLGPADDAALSSKELEDKASQLNNVVMELLQKKMRTPPRPKSSKAKTSKAKSSAKGRASKPSPTTTTTSSSASTPTVVVEEPTQIRETVDDAAMDAEKRTEENAPWDEAGGGADVNKDEMKAGGRAMAEDIHDEL